MILDLTSLTNLYLVLSVVSCSPLNTPILDSFEAGMANSGVILYYTVELFKAHSFTANFIKTLTADGLQLITKDQPQPFQHLTEEDLNTMPVETCGYVIYNSWYLTSSTLEAVSKACVENFITRIPGGLSPLTVNSVPVNWFTLAGDKLLTAILSLDPSYLQYFKREAIKYIGTNPNDICKKIPVSSFDSLSNDQKKLFNPTCLENIENTSQPLEGPPKDNPEKIQNMNINRSLFFNSDIASGNTPDIQNVSNSFQESNSELTIEDVHSSAISLQEDSIPKLQIHVPIAKNTKKKSMIVLNEEPEEENNRKKEIMTFNDELPFKQGDFVMRRVRNKDEGPFVIYRIISDNRINIYDCKTGKYTVLVEHKQLIRKCEEHEIIPCPLFKVEDKVVVKRENNKIVGPFFIAAIDWGSNLYFLSEKSSSIGHEIFVVPWIHLRHFDKKKSDDYVMERLEGEDIVVYPPIKKGDKISFKISSKTFFTEVSTTGTLNCDGRIRIISTDEEIFTIPFHSIQRE